MQKRPTTERLSSISSTRRLWLLHGRLLLSVLFGGTVFFCTLAAHARGATRILIGWDSGSVLYLGLLFRLIVHPDISRTRRRAAVYDEGSRVILLLTTAAAVASLAAVFVELAPTPNANGITSGLSVGLGMSTILLSWLFMHAIFALHYAHEYYGEGRENHVGGLIFPGDENPDYSDFLYYSLVIAMTAQVSDVQITSKVTRWTTTIQAVVSFFFNVAILALTVNVASSLLQHGH